MLGLDEALARGISADALAALMARGEATVLDLSQSRAFREGHIEGAWFAIRARLAQALQRVKPHGRWCSRRRTVCWRGSRSPKPTRWRPARHSSKAARARGSRRDSTLVAGEQTMADQPLDLWLKAYERSSGVKDAMEEYLRWEIDLVRRIEKDGTCRFMPPPAS